MMNVFTPHNFVSRDAQSSKRIAFGRPGCALGSEDGVYLPWRAARLTSASALRPWPFAPCPPPAAPRPLPAAPFGLTLLELLIVIVILTTLVAAAIPLMSPASDARRIREASRGLNTYISSAQAKAVRTGRPVGIYLKRLSVDTGSPADRPVCVEVYQVEQPPPFAGFSETSMARVALDVDGGQFRPNQVVIQFVVRGNAEQPSADGLPLGWDREGIPPAFLRLGDVIQIGDQRYEFIDRTHPIDADIDANGFYLAQNSSTSQPRYSLIARPLNDTGKTLNVVYDNNGNRLPATLPPGTAALSETWTEPARYKILRQPMLTSAEPLQLPDGTAIDLTASGAPVRVYPLAGRLPRMTGALHTPPSQSNPGQYEVVNPIDNDDPIIVMFTPEGTIERLRMRLDPGIDPAVNAVEMFNEPINDNFFLLIGLRANIPSEIADYASTFSLASAPEELAEGRTKVNWLNLESRWVVIGAQTGTVATVENAAAEPFTIRSLVNNNNLTPEPVFQRAYEINRAREYAREVARTGGR